ncbi:DMT family transporter [Jidongwangia harbinensis]|uniref:DMT family transporter n=1 Tax=Jidongwangia harbinensis TaxID=2878561 RepID=UPI001CDA34C1|nr:DMT family transporter [Jidongwangia harbinensis]MCA2212125.1 DMT family transporter [Jidongwangia harbinensis]
MTSALGIAVALSVLSAVSYAAAAVVQERLAAAGHRSVPRWLTALTLTGAGAGLHVIALGYGTVGVVQALGALTLLFALPIAAVRTRVRVTAGAWRDAGLTVAGLAGILALTAAPDGPAVLTGGAGWWLVTVTVGGVALLAWTARVTSSPLARSLLLAGASGAAFGVASVLIKTQTVGIAAGGIGAASVPALTAITVLAVGGLLLGQLSYRGGGLAAPLAMVSVANPVVATAVGILLLGEGFRFGLAGALLALVAAAFATRGVIGLAVRTSAPAGPPRTGDVRPAPRPRPAAARPAPSAPRTPEPARSDQHPEQSPEDQTVILCHHQRVSSLIHAELLADHTVVLTVAGTVAYQSPDQISGAVRAAIVRWAPEAILIDLADVSVLDAAGVTALLESHRTGAWAGVSVVVINVGAFLMGQLRETGLTTLVRAQPPVEAEEVDADDRLETPATF